METENSSISENNISNNKYGVYLDRSSNNSITSNNVCSNKLGIYTFESRSNKIYLNNFINNDGTVFSFWSTSIWNTIEEITYSYNGTTYESYLGNYWDDYNEKHPEAKEIVSSGVWAVPYRIEMDGSDFYPLTVRFENYVL